MVPVLDILALAALLFIAAELYVIARELSRVLTLLLKEREAREGQAPGQTINVNLAPVPGAPAAGSPAGPALSLAIPAAPAAAAEAPTEPAPPEPEAPTQPRAAVPAGARPTASGQLAVKCPACQAENSSYRAECFNCGKPL